MTSEIGTFETSASWILDGDIVNKNWPPPIKDKIKIYSGHLEFQNFIFEKNNVDSAVLNKYGDGKKKAYTLAITSKDGDFLFHLEPSRLWETNLPFPITITNEDIFGIEYARNKWKKRMLTWLLIIIILVILNEF